MSLKPNTEYEWQVRAYNDAGDYIPADGFRMWHSFKTGNYPGPFKKTNPVAGSTNQPLSIKLAWSSTTNAQTYAYCVDDDLSNLLCHGGTEDNFTPIKATEAWVNVLPGRTYRWQVRAYNANGEATPADGLEQWWQFTTQPTTGGFAKIEPPNGVTMYPANSILRWQESQGADSYEYCIDETIDNRCSNYVKTLANSTSLVLKPNTKYEWQVRALNVKGEQLYADGAAQFWTLTTDNSAGPFNKLFPTSGAGNLGTEVELRWSASAGAKEYVYCIDDTFDLDCTGQPMNTWLRTTATSARVTLPLGKSYEWQVRAVTSAGALTPVTPADGAGNWWKVSTASANTASIAGYTQGEFSVNEAGAATYQIPMVVPPGTAGMTPQLALAYDSRGGNSLAGWGWSLSGLSQISRCPATIAQHGVQDGVDFDANDQFCLDGQMLVAVKGVHGVEGTVYRTENESFSRIISYERAGNGPKRFKVWTKAGLIMEYGFTEDSRIEATGRPDVFNWLVTRILDTKGNYIIVNYSKDAVNGESFPKNIQYTANDAAGLVPYLSIEFDYEARPDVSNMYVSGSAFRISQRLKTIRTKYEQTPIREYRLSYDTGVTTKRSRLISVQECGYDGGQATCLAPTRFSWQDSIINYSFAGVVTGLEGRKLPKDQAIPLTGDFDGNGRADVIVLQPDGNHWVGLSNGDTSFRVLDNIGGVEGTTFIKNDISPVSGDINGDGITDILMIEHSGRSWAALANGDGTFTKLANLGGIQNIGYDGGSNFVVSGDFNGDGLIDVLNLQADTHHWLGLSDANKRNGALTFIDRPTGISQFGMWRDKDNVINAQALVGDFNGDGLSDVIMVRGDNKAHDGIHWMGLSKGDGTFTPVTEMGDFQGRRFWVGHTILQISDVNGDGLSDIIGIADDGNHFVAISKGNGQFKLIDQVQGIEGRKFVMDKDQAQILDVNGDGKTDIVMFTPNGAHWVAYSKGDGSFELRENFDTLQGKGFDITGRAFILPDDHNGDGRIDFLNLQTNGKHWIAITPLGNMPDLITRFENAHGVVQEARYRTLTDPLVYSKDNTATYPQRDFQGAMWVVSELRSSNGIGGLRAVHYTYEGLKINLEGRGFLGFRKILARDETAGVNTETTFHQIHPFQSMPIRVEQRLKDGTLVQTSENTWDLYDFDRLAPPALARMSTTTAPSFVVYLPFITCDEGNCPIGVEPPAPEPPLPNPPEDVDENNPPEVNMFARGSGAALLASSNAPNTSGKTYYPFVKRTVVKDYDLNNTPYQTTITENEYDSYGNVTKVVVTYDDGYKVTTNSTFANNNASWILGRLTKAQVTAEASGQNTQSRSSAYEYDPTSGMLIKEVVQPGTALEQIKTYQSDVFGNIVKSTVSGAGITPRTTQTTYNERGRFAITETNALGHSLNKSNDTRFNTTVSQTDPNGQTSTRSYDHFGRVVLEKHADGTSTSTQYARCNATCPVGAVYTIRSESTGSAPSVTYLDVLDRVIRNEALSVDGRKVWVDKEYDGRGLTTRVSEPYFAGSDANSVKWTRYEYDALGRPVKEIALHGGETRTRYNGRTVEVVNANNQSGARTSNSQGKLTQSVDALGGKITYGYDAYGNLTSMTDPAGNVTRMVYDERGRKIEMTDPDMGTVQYRYNAFDEMVYQKDAAGNEVTVRYDEVGRMVERQEREGTSRWNYDTRPRGVGKLAEVTGSDGYKESYDYD
ncbi:MAG: FG-GAP-like repeat-containing protein, partial [Chloroflexota bacterium]